MEKENTADSEYLSEMGRKAEEIVGQINQYGDTIIGSFFIIMVGIIAIYLVHMIASKLLFPHFHKGLLIKVIGVTIYALILIFTALMVFNSIGVDVTVFRQFALLIVFVVVVFIFFLVPFFPRLPFQVGHLIEARGELGTVTAISPLFTTLEKFDGALVFLPNTSIMSMNIRNHSHISCRLIEMNLSVQNDTRLERAKVVLLKLMSEDERVLQEPSEPTVYVMNANAESIELLANCWVKNEDWFSTKCDLWEEIIVTYNEDVRLARPFSGLAN